MEILGKLFGGEQKVKIMRLFLFNPGQTFGVDEIAKRAKVDPRVVKKEGQLLQKTGLIRPRSHTLLIESKHKRSKPRKKKEMGWYLNESFSYLKPLQNLLINTVLLKNAEIINKLNRVGKIKLVIIAGVFIQDWDSRVDLLVVGDSMKTGALENVIKLIESEIGKELRYAAFETADFHYRLGMYDKLIRDILDYPHKKIMDKLNIVLK